MLLSYIYFLYISYICVVEDPAVEQLWDCPAVVKAPLLPRASPLLKWRALFTGYFRTQSVAFVALPKIFTTARGHLMNVHRKPRQTTNVIVVFIWCSLGLYHTFNSPCDKRVYWSTGSLDKLKMPGKLRRNDYDLVEEAYDSKSPVQNEDAFEHGITFKVKVHLVESSFTFCGEIRLVKQQ